LKPFFSETNGFLDLKMKKSISDKSIREYPSISLFLEALDYENKLEVSNKKLFNFLKSV